jgi:hypothetical protein
MMGHTNVGVSQQQQQQQVCSLGQSLSNSHSLLVLLIVFCPLAHCIQQQQAAT